MENESLTFDEVLAVAGFGLDRGEERLICLVRQPLLRGPHREVEQKIE